MDHNFIVQHGSKMIRNVYHSRWTTCLQALQMFVSKMDVFRDTYVHCCVPRAQVKMAR